MNYEGIIRLILALAVPLFMLLVFALEYSKGYLEFDEGTLPLIEMWENIIVFIIGGLLGQGMAVRGKGKDD